MSASDAAMFAHLHRAAAEAGMRLTYDREQGCYWLACGIHCTPLPDLKAVNRALVTGCGLHALYPETLRLVTVELPEPEPVAPVVQEAAPQCPKGVTSQVKQLVRDAAQPADEPPTSGQKPPQSVADLKRKIERRREEFLKSDDWWRKDRTPQNMKKRVPR